MKSQEFKVLLISFASFIVLDFLWLGLVMSEYNVEQLRLVGNFDKNGQFKMNYLPALGAYFLMSLAVAIYLSPNISVSRSKRTTFFWGAGLGLIIYGVFDLTNLAILKNYPIWFIFPDIAWGGSVFGMVCLIVRWYKGLVV